MEQWIKENLNSEEKEEIKKQLVGVDETSPESLIVLLGKMHDMLSKDRFVDFYYSTYIKLTDEITKLMASLMTATLENIK